jgi:transcription initiation factor TFIIB
VGAASNPLLDGDQLDTIISRKDGGTGIARDLNKIQGRATAQKGERNLVEAYKAITSMCDSISLSKLVSDTAKQLYKRVEDEKILRGKSGDAIIAACIFMACRQERVARTFREICALTRVPKKEIGRCCTALKAKLQTSTSVMNSEDLMARFCSNLQLPNYVQKAGVDLVRRAKELGTLAGKSPISVAAACIYLVSYLFKSPRSTKDIANVAGVSEATIKTAYKSLYTEKERLIDLDSWRDKPNCEAITFEELVLP